jgi:hypothetical protein
MNGVGDIAVCMSASVRGSPLPAIQILIELLSWRRVLNEDFVKDKG